MTCREQKISQSWEGFLKGLREKRALMGDVVNTLSVLRDIQMASQDLSELQVQYFTSQMCVCSVLVCILFIRNVERSGMLLIEFCVVMIQVKLI